MQTQTVQKFRFFAPVRDFEKSTTKGGQEVYKVGGLISDDTMDADGEMLDYNGFDLSEFSLINWNHSKHPKDIIGEPESFEIKPGKGLYMNGYIYPDSEVGSEAVKLMKTLKQSKRGNKLGWSVEGQVLERDIINPKKVTKAKVTAVALCPFPKNGNTFADLIQKGFSGDDLYQEDSSLEYESHNNGGEVYIIDEIDSDSGDRVLIDQEGNIKIIKAQTTQNSSALIKEDVEGNPKHNLQKSIVTIVLAHKEGLASDNDLKKALGAREYI
jgi:hypothetical protein